ncbi:MAG: hypothetical protein B6I24_05765 [Bacteroidetes bacterium 4572_128]|nr:MAG: hypothetical protein B6I24_05765 [Bacteroidetes bacterium 4572_128]
MGKKLHTKKETEKLIKEGKTLIIAGSEKLLSKLPEGNWIGGSNPYLQSPCGGLHTEELLYVKDFSDLLIDSKFKVYDKNNIHQITTDAFENGIIATIMPANSEVLKEFAINSPEFENQFLNPLLGWVSGTDFDKFGQVAPTCYKSNEKFIDKAVALHIQLPKNIVARLEILNAYEASNSSEVITFEKDGFHNTDCFVGGKKYNFYKYIEDKNIETLILVANYSGATINIGLIKNEVSKNIFFAAPVFKDFEYKFAKKRTKDYKDFFNKNIDLSNIRYSYSCLYNFFYFELEKEALGIDGLFSYGEIAYQLLNVTFVYLVLDEI